jgi:two-component system CheB/CheR fusion protein
MTPTLRVLYAEDNDQDADLTRSHFSAHAPDFEIEIVTTGRACLHRLSETTADVVLLDHHLPDIEGLEVLRTLVRTGVPVPVVLVTGSGDEELAVKALHLGASNYVPKLGRYLETLPDLLRAVIERHRLGLREGLLGSARHRILYVEHESVDIDLTLRHFAETAPHFDVDVVTTSEGALARLGQPPAYDAALIDLRMPDLSGLDFVSEAGRRHLRLPPFIVTTGRGDEAAAVASLKLGAVDYVLKREGYLDKLVYIIDRAIAHDRLRHTNEQLQVELAERKRVEQSLRESDRRKDEYLGLLSHELRNPLMPIRNSVYILDRVMPGSDQARQALAIIDRQVTHLARLVDDLLDVTRIGRGKIQLQRTRVELNLLVSRAVEDHRSVFAEREIALEVRPATEPLFIDGDATRLAQLVGNLLQNAAKFTGRGGRATVHVGQDGARHQAVVRVCDSGAGIPKEILPHLFEPFMQADHTLARSHGGLGLRLAMVKGLVELHGGEVSADSEGIGKGAEFTVRLPLDQHAPDDAAPLPVSRPAGAGRRVLVIEDNVDAATSLRQALALDGHLVETAYNGAEGLEKLRAVHPEIVLCDIGLPGMSGYEVARSIRADVAFGKVVLVAVTGYSQPDEVARAKEAGFDEHLTKPPSVDKLRELLSLLPERKIG